MHLTISSFQSTPLREGRQFDIQCHRASIYNFNPRPSVRGDNVGRLETVHYPDFNPRPSVRGDKKAMKAVGLTQISIHAPP